MEFTFESTELRAVCLRKKAATRIFGEDGASELIARLADLAACQSALEFLELFPDDIDVQGDHVTLRVNSEVSMKFKAGHIKPRISRDGSPNWAETTRVRILSVEARDV